MSRRPAPGVVHCGEDQEWPETTDPGCCYGSIIYGPQRCTCWEPALDFPVTGPVQEGPMGVRPGMCGDCAFRPDSPERTGAEGAGHDVEDLDDVVFGGEFACHDGMPRPVEWVHPPTGMRTTRAGDVVDYQPRQAGHRSWRQDGRPTVLCAGWAARRRALTAGLERAADLA